MFGKLWQRLEAHHSHASSEPRAELKRDKTDVSADVERCFAGPQESMTCIHDLSAKCPALCGDGAIGVERSGIYRHHGPVLCADKATHRSGDRPAYHARDRGSPANCMLEPQLGK